MKSASVPVALHTSEHHPTLYFDDGNVVLAASMASGSTQRFRVHKSCLASQSSVFADMFSLPCVENADEIYDGVPLVYMQDGAEDIESLLKVLYDPLFLPSKRRNPKTTFLLHGALKLAQKYDLLVLRERIIEHVQNQWPQTLQEWDLYQEELRVMRASESGVDYENGPWLEPVSGIHFGREFGSLDFVFNAYYLLSTLRYDCQGVRWDLMEHKDWMNLLQGQHTIWLNPDFARNVESIVEDSLCGHSCRRALKRAASENDSYHAVPCDSFSFAATVYNETALGAAGVCEECTMIVVEEAGKTRQTNWDQIGGWFDK